MITVIFDLDLSQYRSLDSSPDTVNKAVLEIRDSIRNNGVIASDIRYQSKALFVLRLPDDEKVFGDLLYWCNYCGLSYNTLWLNDVAEWRSGGH